MKIAVFPRLLTQDNPYGNPYIRDFVDALEQNGVVVTNSPHKNPLLNMLPFKTTCDAYVFHWIEDIPSAKHGLLQTAAALGLVLWAKALKRKTVWFLHNKRPHGTGREQMKQYVARFMMKHADLIVTHAQEGIDIIRGQYPPAVARTVFLHHPTKNRLTKAAVPSVPKDTDLLIWGNISKYKRVAELLRFSIQHHWELRIKVIGRCTSRQIFEEMEAVTKGQPRIHFENRDIPFEELEVEIQKSRFVLVPYASQTILSSGILMDSLSFGAQVIGPNVGSFKDYAHEPLVNVYTFGSFSDIPSLVSQADKPYELRNYKTFLDSHDWNAFGRTFSELISS